MLTTTSSYRYLASSLFILTILTLLHKSNHGLRRWVMLDEDHETSFVHNSQYAFHGTTSEQNLSKIDPDTAPEHGPKLVYSQPVTVHHGHTPSTSPPLEVAITETMGWHAEGMKDVIQSFDFANSPPSYQEAQRLNDENVVPDVILMTTCERDLLNIHPEKLDQLYNMGKTYISCICHLAYDWDEPQFEPLVSRWIEKGRFKFLALSPHVAKGMEERIGKWKVFEPPPGSSISAPSESAATIDVIDVFVPVFTVPLQNRTNDEEQQKEISFSMQGNIEGYKRDYPGVIASIEELVGAESSLDEETQKNHTLYIVGQKWDQDFSVPGNLADHIFYLEDLNYIDYYGTIAHTSAILPAFLDRAFLESKASSSIPSAITCGTPLITTREVLETYAYLSENVTWLMEEGETRSDVMRRISTSLARERMEKKDIVIRQRDRIIQDNIQRVKRWITEAKTKVHR